MGVKNLSKKFSLGIWSCQSIKYRFELSDYTKTNSKFTAFKQS